MRLLTATTATQGQHPGDFTYCDPTELVTFPPVYCDRDLNADDPATDGCGCGRSFTGLSSGKGTTTAEVRDLDISLGVYALAIASSREQQGWAPEDAAGIATHLSEVAARCPVGTVLGHLLGRLYVRPLNSAHALAIHNFCREHDPDHDQVSCWCCCWDCDINYAITVENDKAQGLTSVFS